MNGFVALNIQISSFNHGFPKESTNHKTEGQRTLHCQNLSRKVSPKYCRNMKLTDLPVTSIQRNPNLPEICYQPAMYFSVYFISNAFFKNDFDAIERVFKHIYGTTMHTKWFALKNLLSTKRKKNDSNHVAYSRPFPSKKFMSTRGYKAFQIELVELLSWNWWNHIFTQQCTRIQFIDSNRGIFFFFVPTVLVISLYRLHCIRFSSFVPCCIRTHRILSQYAILVYVNQFCLRCFWALKTITFSQLHFIAI